jgi:hypothetical protein
MSTFTNVYEEVSVVVVGSLNPAIFNPDWLLRHELLSEEDVAEQVSIDVIHPEVCRFSLPWCDLEVLTNRLIIRTHQKGYFEATRDLAVGMFSVLSETPVTGIGLNTTYRDVFDSREGLDRIGDSLAPKQPWKSILPDSPRHGLSRLNIQSERADDVPGVVNTHILPVLVEEKHGIETKVNCHFDFALMREGSQEATVGEVILGYWDESLRVAETAHANILDLAEGC